MLFKNPEILITPPTICLKILRTLHSSVAHSVVQSGKPVTVEVDSRARSAATSANKMLLNFLGSWFLVKC